MGPIRPPWCRAFCSGPAARRPGLDGRPAAARQRRIHLLHFNLSHAASKKWLKAHAALADEFYETLHQGSPSNRIELAENNLIAVVNDMQHDFSFEASDISTLWINVTQDIVISAPYALAANSYVLIRPEMDTRGSSPFGWSITN